MNQKEKIVFKLSDYDELVMRYYISQLEKISRPKIPLIMRLWWLLVDIYHKYDQRIVFDKLSDRALDTTFRLYIVFVQFSCLLISFFVYSYITKSFLVALIVLFLIFHLMKLLINKPNLSVDYKDWKKLKKIYLVNIVINEAKLFVAMKKNDTSNVVSAFNMLLLFIAELLKGEDEPHSSAFYVFDVSIIKSITTDAGRKELLYKLEKTNFI